MSSASSVRCETPSVPHWTHDYQLVRLDEDAEEIAELVAEQRAASYLAAKTGEVVYDTTDENARDTFRSGTRAEVATALLLDRMVLEAIDLEVSETGDDGSDLELRETEKRVDVKAYEGLPAASRAGL